MGYSFQLYAKHFIFTPWICAVRFSLVQTRIERQSIEPDSKTICKNINVLTSGIEPPRHLARLPCIDTGRLQIRLLTSLVLYSASADSADSEGTQQACTCSRHMQQAGNPASNKVVPLMYVRSSHCQEEHCSRATYACQVYIYTQHFLHQCRLHCFAYVTAIQSTCVLHQEFVSKT